MKSWLPLVASLVLGISACASMRNTPQQDYVEEMGANCARTGQFMGGTRVVRVAPDGRYWVFAPGEAMVMRDEYPRFFACMKEQYQAHPFLDWLKAQKREAQGPLAAVGSTSVAAFLPSGPIVAPVWQVGDEWQYAYKSPSDSGSYVWSVNRIETLDGDQHYVIKTGTREIFYRTTDLASSIERVDGVIVVRNTPSRTSFTWPLTLGKSWEQGYQEERPVDRSTSNRVSTWQVESEETVTVPAGIFRAFKIASRNKNTGALIYEMWYAPEVKQWVKIREVLTTGIRERELISFKLGK